MKGVPLSPVITVESIAKTDGIVPGLIETSETLFAFLITPSFIFQKYMALSSLSLANPPKINISSVETWTTPGLLLAVKGVSGISMGSQPLCF